MGSVLLAWFRRLQTLKAQSEGSQVPWPVGSDQARESRRPRLGQGRQQTEGHGARLGRVAAEYWYKLIPPPVRPDGPLLPLAGIETTPP